MLEPSNSSLNSTSHPVSGAGGDLVQQLCKTLERRLRAGESIRCEELLADHPELVTDPEQALDLIYTEYSTRCELGEKPAASEFTSRFPQWQMQLDEQFQLDEFLDADPTIRIRSGGDSEHSSRRLGAREAGGRFRVLSLLARGGIGQVMRAVDTELNREVAVKEIQPALAEIDDVRERFLREAEITGRLEHPGVVPVYGKGEDCDERPYYAMRLVRGESFHQAIEDFHARAKNRPRFDSIEFKKMLRRFLSVCETIAYAHSRGVIHRDIKPQNILFGPFGETLVVDWGLAKVTNLPEPLLTQPNPDPTGVDEPRDVLVDDLELPSTSTANWSVELTQSAGALIGTPAFMSPEQARGESQSIGPASDVYSLGATLHTLLTGRKRFADSDVNDTLQQVIAGDFARPRDWNRSIPRSLEAICLKALALRPEDRYASASDLAGDIEHWLADEPVSAARESIAIRLTRWGRRNRNVAFAGLVAMLLITAISTIAAFRINSERLRADGERIDANRQRFEADHQRVEADRERIEANRQRVEANRRNARLAFNRGFALTKDHEYGEGMLWFSRALDHAPHDDTALRRVILTNMDAARHHLVRRGLAFSHPADISKVAFSPDGTTCLTTDRAGTARIWDVVSGEVKASHKLASSLVSAAVIREDGTPLVAVSTNRTLLLKSLAAVAADGTATDVALAHPDTLRCAAFSPDGTLFATGSSESAAPNPTKIRIWRAADGDKLAEFDVPAVVDSVTFQPKGSAVATLSTDGVVRLWDATKGGMVGDPLKLDRTVVTRIAFTTDGGRVLVSGRDQSLSCWDVSSRKRVVELPKHRSAIVGLACASDGQTVVASLADGTARAWNLLDGRAVGELFRLDRHAGRLMFRPGTRQILISADSHSFVLWDIPDPSRLEMRFGQVGVKTGAFSLDGAKVVTGGQTESRSGTARVRDTATGLGFGQWMWHDRRIKRVAFRPDAAVVLTASEDGTTRLWNAANGKARCEPMNHQTQTGARVQVEAAVFSPDGRFVLTGGSDGIVRLWDGDTGELIREFKKVNGVTTSVCFSPDGVRVVAGFGNPDKRVWVWDTASGELLWKSASHRGSVRIVAVSPDGRVVMAAGNDKTARFFDARDGTIGPELQHRGEVHTAAFSPNGQLAVTGGYDATVRLWEVPSGRLVGEPMRHDHVVTGAAFSSDGKRLLTAGSNDKSARLWDVTTCLPLCPPIQHNDDVMSVALDPAGLTAFTGRLWHLPTPLPDDPEIVNLWVKLATQRAFMSGDNVEWLDADAVASLTLEFQARTGKSWSEWADDAHQSFQPAPPAPAEPAGGPISLRN